MESIQRKEGEGFSRIRIAMIVLLTFILVTWFTYLLMYGGSSSVTYIPTYQGGPGAAATAPAEFSGSGNGTVLALAAAALVGLVLLVTLLGFLAIRASRSAADAALRMSRQDRMVSLEHAVGERRSEILHVLNPLIDAVYEEPIDQERTTAQNQHNLSRQWRLARARIRAIVPAWGKATDAAFLNLVNETLKKYDMEPEDIMAWETDVMDAFDRFTDHLWGDVARAYGGDGESHGSGGAAADTEGSMGA
jgi:hypothetical protein